MNNEPDYENNLYFKPNKRVKNTKFENSILHKQLGWTEADYIRFVCDMSSFKIDNNLQLTPDEFKIYSGNVDEYEMEKMK